MNEEMLELREVAVKIYLGKVVTESNVWTAPRIFLEQQMAGLIQQIMQSSQPMKAEFSTMVPIWDEIENKQKWIEHKIEFWNRSEPW